MRETFSTKEQTKNNSFFFLRLFLSIFANFMSLGISFCCASVFRCFLLSVFSSQVVLFSASGSVFLFCIYCFFIYLFICLFLIYFYSFSGKIYGLVAPGYEMAEVVANVISGQDDHSFTGADMSTKLKLMGVDVASFGRYSGFKVRCDGWRTMFWAPDAVYFPFYCLYPFCFFFRRAPLLFVVPVLLLLTSLVVGTRYSGTRSVAGTKPAQLLVISLCFSMRSWWR